MDDDRHRRGEELTPREREILRLAREGLSNNEIAERLGLKHNALRFHLKHLHAKLMTDGQRAALASASGRRWGWLPLAFTGWLAPAAGVIAVVAVSAGGYLAVRAANESHGGDGAVGTQATPTATATPPAAAPFATAAAGVTGTLIGTPTTIRTMGGNPALFGAFPDATDAPTMTANVHAISPSHMGMVQQSDTRTPDRLNPRGACAEVTFDTAAPNIQWFRMAVDESEVTHDLTVVVRPGNTGARLCYAPKDGLPPGSHFASVVVVQPGSDGPPSQRIAWTFRVLPKVGR